MIASAAVAVALAGAATWVVVGSPSAQRLRTLVGPPDQPTAATRVRTLMLAAAGRVGFGPASRRRRGRDRAATIEALGALAAELAAGQPPATALVRAAGEPPVWPHATAAVRMGGEVPAALRLDGTGRPALRQLAACWQVAAQTGSGLASSVDQLARSSRRAEQVRGELEAQLAAPRATARLLAGLPLVGVAFGVLLGADPLGWLLGSAAGRLCLAGGVALTVAGAWWTGRIAARVERLL